MTALSFAVQHHPALVHEDANIRRLALIDLADEEQAEHLPIIIHALRHDTHAEVRTEAAQRLEGWETPEAVSVLCQALADPAEPVAQAAARSLAELRDAANAHLLLEHVAHPNAFVRASIFRALRELRSPVSRIAAQHALTDNAPSVRREAASVLGWLKCSESDVALAQLAHADPDADVRRIAVGTLANYYSEAAQHALQLGTQDSVWSVRQEAARTLGKHATSQAGPVLMALLSDDYWQVRQAATQALGKIQYHAAQPRVIALLEHPISNLRREAALALGELGNHDCYAPLQAALEDADPEVRKAVRIALQQVASR